VPSDIAEGPRPDQCQQQHGEQDECTTDALTSCPRRPHASTDCLARRLRGGVSRKRKKTISKLPKKTRTALGKQGAAVAKRKRSGGSEPKTRAELDEIAKKRDLPGRSKMGRDELARALGRH
jgi:hypothetical protein